MPAETDAAVSVEPDLVSSVAGSPTLSVEKYEGRREEESRRTKEVA